jgi:predicted regulator of Ras-like GTPase activity (Roadblock/LC7/MglB family)
MSVDSRIPTRGLRRGKKEPDRPDYSEPDFSSWAARLADYAPVSPTAPESAPAAAPAATATVADVAPTASAFAPAAATTLTATAVDVAPAAPARDDRPSLEAVLEKLLSFDGAMCVAVVDSASGMILGKAGSGVELDLAAAGASTILRARLESTRALGTNEKIDDVLISLTSQVQIIHPLPSNPSIFTYLIGDKAKSSLAMARYKATEADLQIQL